MPCSSPSTRSPPGRRRTPTYSDYAAYDLGQAVAQLSVQALALGLVVHQFAGFDHEQLAAQADVPRHWQVTTGVALGRELAGEESGGPAARERDRRPRTRKPLAELAFGRQVRRPAGL